MKVRNLCVLVLLMLSMGIHAQQSNITLDVREATIQSVLDQLTQKDGLTFSYSEDLINLKQKITLQMKEVSVDHALQLIFKNTGIGYVKSQRMVTLFPTKEKPFMISGYVKEKGSGELLIGASVTSIPLYTGTITNAYGFFALELPSDSFRIQISYIGYNKQNLTVSRGQKDVFVELVPCSNLDEVTVSAGRDDAKIVLNKTIIPGHEIQGVPMILGEKDVVKYMMLSPGVQKGSEGNAYMYVRGGGPDQNLILIDDAVIYNAYHFLGLSSLFSGNELRQAELIKGGFSSKYGGRLSSVLNMSMKDGNNHDYHSTITLGVMSSRVLVEGPIVKDKASFLISFRKSYIDQTAKLISGSSDAVLNYGYLDFHSKIATNLGLHDRLMVSTYMGRDQLANNSAPGLSISEDGIQWGNQAVSLRWNHQFGPKLFTNTACVYSYYKSRIAFGDLDNNTQTISSSAVQSEIADISLKQDWDYAAGLKSSFKGGAGITRHLFTSQTSMKTVNPDFIISNTKQATAHESFGYLEWDYHPHQRWLIIPGVRLSYYKLEASYARLEPRLNISYSTPTNWSFQASYARMNQYLHLVSAFNGFGIPSDAWVPTDQVLKPQQSDIITLGLVKNDIGMKGWSVSFETYAKQSNHAVALKEGASFFQVLPMPYMNSTVKSWNELATQGNSYSYGMEWMLRKYGKHINGYLSYTLSRTMMQFNDLNFGNEFPATYDRRHDLGIYLTYQTGKHIQLSLNWLFGTGYAITLPAGEYFNVQHDPGGSNSFWPSYYYDQKNNARMRDYHRLDVSMMYTGKLTTKIQHTIELSIYNIYNRNNPFYYQIDYANAMAGTGKRKLQQLSLFPLMPSISWTLNL